MLDNEQAALSGTIATATSGIGQMAELGALGRFGRFGSLLGELHGDFVGRLAIQTGTAFTLSSGYDVAFRGASFSHAFQRNLGIFANSSKNPIEFKKSLCLI